MISLILAAQENQPNYIIQALDKVFGCRYFVIGIWKSVHGVWSFVIVNSFSDSELVVGIWNTIGKVNWDLFETGGVVYLVVGIWNKKGN